MLGINELWLFIISGLLLNITPGPDTAYIVGRSLQMGWRGGAAAALGISAGCLVHVFAAAIGLSALLAASSVAFTAIKLFGAAYLIYIGIRMLLAHPNDNAPTPGTVDMLSLPQVFWQGALTNVLNPKVALFFLAFLPQFVAADAPGKALAFIVLGFIFIFQRHDVVPRCRGLRGEGGRPPQALQPRGVVDQSHTRRHLHRARHPRRDDPGAMMVCVIAGLDPAIHPFRNSLAKNDGCAGQARA